MRRRLERAAAGCAIVLAGAAAWADDRIEPPDLEHYLRWGPLRVRPGLEVSNLGYDSNVYSSSADPVGDYRGTVSPRIEGLVLFGRRAFLSFEERLDFTAYLEEHSQDYTNNQGRARFTFPLRRAAVVVDGSLAEVFDRPSDREDTRVERNERGGGVGLLVLPGWRTEVEVGWDRMRKTHTDPDDAFGDGVPVSARLDRDEEGPRVEVRYLLEGRTHLTLEARTRRFDFDEVVEFDDRWVDRDSDSWTVLPGIDFGADGRLWGTLQLGWAAVVPDDPTVADFSEAVGRAELGWRFTPSTLLRLVVEREPSFAVYEDSIYVLNSSVGLHALRYLNRFLGLEAAGSRGRLTFPDSGTGTAASREDTLERYAVGLRFRLAENSAGRRVEYSLRYMHYDRESNVPGAEQSKTGLGLGAVIGF